MREHPELIYVLVIMMLMSLSIHISNRIFRSIYKRKSHLHYKFLNSVINVVLTLLSVYLMLAQFKLTQDVSKTLLQSSTLIIAIATFAAQKVLSNVIAGFSISASRPCDIGQKVRIIDGGSVIAEGLVTDMTMRHVVIVQYDGQSCIVPNAVIDGAVIINTHYSSPYGNILEFEVGYDTDVDRAREVILRVCNEEPLLIQKETLKVMVSRLTANGLMLKVTIWTKELDESFLASSNLRQHIVAELQKENIVIPYQTVTLDQSDQ